MHVNQNETNQNAFESHHNELFEFRTSMTRPPTTRVRTLLFEFGRLAPLMRGFLVLGRNVSRSRSNSWISCFVVSCIFCPSSINPCRESCIGIGRERNLCREDGIASKHFPSFPFKRSSGIATKHSSTKHSSGIATKHSSKHSSGIASSNESKLQTASSESAIGSREIHRSCPKSGFLSILTEFH